MFLLAAGFLQLAGPVSAHHGVSGYDMDKVVTLTGTVTSFDWSNPHCLLHIDVKDSSGEHKDWIIELAAPTIMRRNGWSKDSMKPGDSVDRRDSPRQERRDDRTQRRRHHATEIRGQWPRAPIAIPITTTEWSRRSGAAN